MVSQAFADEEPGMAQFSPNYMQAQPGFQTPNSPSTFTPPQPQHQQHQGMMSSPTCQQDLMAPHMHRQHSHMSPHMLPPISPQAGSSYRSPQQLSQQQQHQHQRAHEQQLQQREHEQQLQQQFHQQQEQQFQQREHQQHMRQQRMFQLQEQLHRQQQLQQQQQQQVNTQGQGQGQGQGIPRSASVSHMNMQWQPAESFGRSASASNLLVPGRLAHCLQQTTGRTTRSLCAAS